MRSSSGSRLAGFEIARRPGAAASAPFFDRVTVMVAATVSLAALLAYGFLYGASDRGTGALGALAAGALGIGVVSGVIAWVGAAVLAVRSGFVIGLLLLVVFPIFIGPVAVALWSSTGAPPPPGSRPPW